MDRCWLWTGYTDALGYGRARVDGKQVKVHRAAYEAAVGPIPPGLEIDHLCSVRNEFWAAKTHCPQDHPYDEQNTFINKKGGRVCLTCKRAARRRYSTSKAA